MLYGFDALNNLIYNDCREHLDNLYRINGYDNIIIEYINRTIASKTFFEDDDIENLKDEYLKKLNQIVYTFKDYTFKMKILIYMELMRLNAMYESIGEEVAIISQTGLNVAFLGKGVCDAQSKYLCNLLISSGFKAKSVRTHTNDNHAVTAVELENNKCVILDPTSYDGDKNILNKATSIYRAVFKDRSWAEGIEWGELITNDEEIKKARCLALAFLENKFNLKKISLDLHLNELSIEQKIIKIIIFIESILIPKNNLPLNFRSVEVNGEELDVGKMLELMFYANGIRYKVIPIGNTKASSLLQIDLFGKKVILNPLYMYPRAKKWAAYFDDKNSPKLISDNLELQTKIDEEFKNLELKDTGTLKKR